MHISAKSGGHKKVEIEKLSSLLLYQPLKRIHVTIVGLFFCFETFLLAKMLREGNLFELVPKTQYMTCSYIVFTLKVKSASKNTIFSLTVMVKSGLFL